MLQSVVVWSISTVGLFRNPPDCSPPVFSVHGIFQATILEWVAISFSRGASQPRDQTHVLLYWQADSLLLSHQRSPGQGILGVANQFPCPELSSQVLSNDHIGSFPTMFCLHLKASWPLVHMLVAQLCPILCESTDCGPPGSVHGIL